MKILNTERRDNFVASIFMDSDVAINMCNERGSNIHIPICLMEEVKTKLEENKIRKVTCPHCVHTHISNHILNKINDIIPRYNVTDSSELRIWKEYRPTDYQNLVDQLMRDS